MSVIFHKKHILRSKKRLNKFTYKVWRLVYLVRLNDVYHNSEKKIYARSSQIPISFNRYEVLVYSGRRWVSKQVNPWMVGYRFGEFTWNRKYALYKAKSKKKKK